MCPSVARLAVALLLCASAPAAAALRDATHVLRHDPGLSGVFLRPDTLDQFLSHGPWRQAPPAVEYATYCMAPDSSYVWGPYSNGPGLYARERLLRAGRQLGGAL